MNAITSESFDSSFSVQDSDTFYLNQELTEHFIKNSNGEELSMYFKDFGLNNSLTRSDVLVEKSNSLLFRYEGGGVIVYDSHAHKSGEIYEADSQQTRTIPTSIQREIETASENGNINIDKSQYKKLSFLSPKKFLNSEYTLVVPTKNVLIFDSKFESGNLGKAIKLSENEYNLYLDFDFNTNGHTQWFYFSVKTYMPRHKVTLNIVNLLKYDSLYNDGMKPLVYSKKMQEKTGIDWHRAGENISYYRNNIVRNDSGKKECYFSLSFTYEFLYEDDTVYFAHCFPYTYTDLQNFLTKSQENSDILRVDTLCQTLAGNNCYILTITSNVNSYTPWEFEYEKLTRSAAWRKIQRNRSIKFRMSKPEENEHSKKKGIVFTARVHPGETNSSYMMQGAIEFLLGNSKEAKILRDNFIFRIIPMLNPDGVIYGNYRTSLLGVDLNRRWQFPNKHLHPTIYYAKRFIKMFSEDHELVLYLDMHGHSMKKNVFMYCCCSQGKEMEDRKTNVLIKLVPLLLSEKNKIFSFKDSKFRMEKSKESTSRIVLFKELHLLNSYTLESSFYGPSHRARLENREPEEGEPEGDAHMDRQHLKNLGADTCKVCLIYCNPALFKKKIQTILNKFRKKPQPFNFSQRKTNKSAKELELADDKDSSSDTENEEEDEEEEVDEEENIEELEEDFHLDEALKVIEGNESLMDIEQLWKIDEVSSSDSSQSENENEETKLDLSNEIRLKRRKNTKRTSRSPKKHQTSSVPRPKQCSHLPRINPLRPVTIIERKPIQEVLEHNLDSIYNLLQSWDKQTMKTNDFFRQPKRNLHEIGDERDFDYLKTLSTKSKQLDSPNDYFKITSANFLSKKPPSRKGVRSLSRRDEIQVQKYKNGMRPLDIRKENPYDPMPLSAFSYHSDINLTKKYK